jgi:glycosyltransferase involved in cell wall biosynthesis
MSLMPKNFPVVAYLTHVEVLGGGERSLWDLMSGIRNYSYDPLLLAPSGSVLSQKSKKTRIKSQHFSFGLIAPRASRQLNIFLLPLYILDLIPPALKLLWVCKKNKIKILHSSSVKAHFLSAILRFTKTSVIWHVRDIFPRGFGLWLIRFFAWFVPTKIICISHEVAKQFGTNHKKVVVVYNGIDFAAIRSQSKVPLGLKKFTPPTICCVGQVAHWKGQDVFVEAVKILKDRGLRLTALIVGSVLAPEREAHFGVNLSNRIKELGLKRRWVTVLRKLSHAL